MSDKAINNILAATCAVKILAKDLHYRAKGKTFYGEHLLADAVGSLDKSNDDLVEVYYLGQMGKIPPMMWEIHGQGVALAARGLSNPEAGEDDVLTALLKAVDDVVQGVERAKAEEITGGLSAVLDDISKKALVASGLLKRTIENGESASGGEGSASGFKAVADAIREWTATKKTATDEGTSEGAKKGWETKKHGGGVGGASSSSSGKVTSYAKKSPEEISTYLGSHYSYNDSPVDDMARYMDENCGGWDDEIDRDDFNGKTKSWKRDFFSSLSDHLADEHLDDKVDYHKLANWVKAEMREPDEDEMNESGANHRSEPDFDWRDDPIY